MRVDFVKLSPTENMTVLIKTPVPRDKQLAVGAAVMDYSSVYAEQAGFFEPPEDNNAEARLQMMAGEFCGNATMAAAAYMAAKKGISMGERMNIRLEVSGAEGVLTCCVEALEDGFRGTVNMPLPIGISSEKYAIDGKEYELPTVRLPGIRHIILPREEIGESFKEKLGHSVESLKTQINDDAFGIIVFDEPNGRIDPLVVVKSAGSIFWERGCGSGSEAVGVYLANRERRSMSVSLGQPGGTIDVDVKYENGIRTVTISGIVKISAEGTAYIKEP